MGRLTYKNYIEEYEVNLEKSSDKNWGIAESDTHIKVMGEPIDKLGELEDVLEKWHIEDLDKFIEEQITKKRELNDILWKMEKELTELKQNAIIPKYQIGQKVFIIFDGTVKETNIDSISIFAGNELVYYCKYVNNEKMYLELDEEEIFVTKEEAEQKLAETKGWKDE